MRCSFRLYFRVFGACTLAGIFLLAGLNLLVDPLSAYRKLSFRALEPYRGHLTSRTAKAEMIARGDCQVLLLGSSRVINGMPVTHSAYGADRVYNLGLNATALTETAGVLNFALRKNRLKRALFGVDFFLFSEARGNSAVFENSRFNPDLNLFDYHCRNAFGSQAIDDSQALLRQALRGKPAPGERGFLPKTIPHGAAQRDIFAARIRGFLVNRGAYSGFRYATQRLEMFREMVRRCRRENVDLVVFIPPIHALQLETIRAAGLWPTFEQWKGDLSRILAEEGAGEPVPFWDFTGFTGPVTEAVPPAGDTTTRMKWYLDSSHFMPALGDFVLQRILGPERSEGSNRDFGVRLNSQNVGAHLARVRSDREAYVSANRQEELWLAQIVASAKVKKDAKGDEF